MKLPVNPPCYSAGDITQASPFCQVFEESDSVERLREQLDNHRSLLKYWNTHYDYQYWGKVEEFFNSIWDKLRADIYLGIEYECYTEIKALFFDIRNLLQSTGRLSDRVYFAVWIYRCARNYGHVGVSCLAMSSLLWSYTSSGCHQNLEKADSLRANLCQEMKLGKPGEFTVDEDLIEELGEELYVELLLETCENIVRLEIRHERFQSAMLAIQKADEILNVLFGRGLISPRLCGRAKLAFLYHQGIISYKNCDYENSKILFQEIVQNSSVIGWERISKGAHSWLATIAMEQNQIATCKKILISLYSSDALNSPLYLSKRNAFCCLIHAKSLEKEGKLVEKSGYEKMAMKIFARFSEGMTSCDLNSFSLLLNEIPEFPVWS